MNDRAPLLSRAVRGKKGFRTAVFVLVLAAAAAGPAAAQQAVILVRHAEKADSSKDSALSEAGRARAEALAVLVAPLGITAVYASEYRRARLTAEPAAAALGLKVQTYAAGDAAGVIGHSNTLPELMRRLGHPSEEIIADDDYGSLFVLLPQTGDTPVVVRLHY
ncbi:MAG: Histidine phosphatase superfamily (branch 1) [Candidatus Aminicenantes bacterium ADurb.Bin147]|nr:MAG: Histidine phosphatase superfamily (branch 1) [Candidatus Aminicenantes bacterium ADurb.Bin147]